MVSPSLPLPDSSRSPASPPRRLLGLSIRWTLPVLTILPVVTGIGLTGWLAYHSGRIAVHRLADQLSVEITQRIEQRVDSYLAEPQVVQSAVVTSFQSNLLNLQDVAETREYFWRLTGVDQPLHTLYYGTEAGDFYGVSRGPDGLTEYWVRNAQTAPMRQYFRLSEAGEPAELLQQVPYDHRQRPWYGPAIASQQPRWSPIYQSVSPPDLTITHSVPFQDASGRIVGVLAVDLFLQDLSQFLQQLSISQSGEAFILERSGNLVAVSTGLPYRMEGEAPIQMAVLDADNPVVQATAQHLVETYGSFEAIAAGDSLSFEMADQGRQMVRVGLLNQTQGLDWLIVVVIPEKDFMGVIDANRQSIIVVGLGITLGATLLGLLAALWIIRPIQRLNQASQSIQANQFAPETLEPTTARSDELGKLAKLFLDMALVVSSREQSLSEQVSFLRSEMQQYGGLSSAQLSQLQTLLERSQAARANVHQAESSGSDPQSRSEKTAF